MPSVPSTLAAAAAAGRERAEAGERPTSELNGTVVKGGNSSVVQRGIVETEGVSRVCYIPLYCM